MKIDSKEWNWARAELFVQELFKYMLQGVVVPSSEIAAWTKRALEMNDPADIIQAVANIPAVKSTMCRANDTRTRWPDGHFYSPIVSRKEIYADRERVFAHRSLPGIDLRPREQLDLLGRLAPSFGNSPFSDNLTPPHRYHYDNPSYNYGDAVVYWAMLNLFQPRRIIEIGSGYSSALALDTIDILKLPTSCTFVDPYPETVQSLANPLGAAHRIIPKRIQEINITEFDVLESGDLLFIDSSHVMKTGSDVHFEITEVLPRLKRGVLVHFHDAFGNFEYPPAWVLHANHSWNELYALHSFLMFNTAFRIEYFNHFLAISYPEQFKALAPEQASRILLNPGGGLWLRRM